VYLMNLSVKLKGAVRRLGATIFPFSWFRMLYCREFKRVPRIVHPINYSEKLGWLRFWYATRPEIGLAADKGGVHEVIEAKGLGKYRVPLVGIWDSFNEVPWDELPNQYLVKKSNGTAQMIVVRDEADISLPDFRDEIAKWQKNSMTKLGEPHYDLM